MSVPERIFDYVSPDRTRSWKVVRAIMWPISIRESVGAGADSKMIVQAAIGTDFVKGLTWNTMLDPTENRNFGWAVWSGYSRENG